MAACCGVHSNGGGISAAFAAAGASSIGGAAVLRQKARAARSKPPLNFEIYKGHSLNLLAQSKTICYNSNVQHLIEVQNCRKKWLNGARKEETTNSVDFGLAAAFASDDGGRPLAGRPAGHEKESGGRVS